VRATITTDAMPDIGTFNADAISGIVNTAGAMPDIAITSDAVNQAHC